MSEKAHACIQGTEQGMTWQGHLANGVQLPRPSIPRSGPGPRADNEQVDNLEPLQINILEIVVQYIFGGGKGEADFDHSLPITSFSRCYSLSEFISQLGSVAQAPWQLSLHQPEVLFIFT